MMQVSQPLSDGVLASRLRRPGREGPEGAEQLRQRFPDGRRPLRGRRLSRGPRRRWRQHDGLGQGRRGRGPRRRRHDDDGGTPAATKTPTLLLSSGVLRVRGQTAVAQRVRAFLVVRLVVVVVAAAVGRRQVVGVGASRVRVGDALLVAEELPLQAVVLGLQGADFASGKQQPTTRALTTVYRGCY